MHGSLDPCLHNAIGPDYFLGGIANYLQEVCVLQLKSIKHCSRLEACLSSEMKEAGLSSQDVLFDYKNRLEIAFLSTAYGLINLMPVALKLLGFDWC